MPSKDDLSEQLQLTQKLAAQVERMAQAAEKLESAFTAQQATLTQLVQTLNQLNVQGGIQGLTQLNDVLKNFHTNLTEASATSDSFFKKVGKKLEDLGSSFSKKFPKSVLVATAAMSGFWQGLKNVTAVTKSVGSFFATFVKGATNLTASILSIPVKIFSGLIDMAAQSAGGSNELAEALEALRKEFGAFYAPTNKAIIDTTISMKGFSDTGLSTWRVFGNMADRLKYIGKLAGDMGASFLLLRKEMEDNGGAVLGYQKGLGLSNEAMKALTLRSDALGKKTTDTLKDMTKFSYGLAGTSDNAKVISREIGEAAKDMAHFGSTSIKSLGESVTFAHKFGLELKDITGQLDAFQSFDDAAEHAAKLQQAFGANVDVMGMMKASASGDVAKATDLLRKSFRQAGVDGASLNAVQRKLIKDNTGLSDEAINNAFAMKKQSTSLNDVRKAGSAAEKKTMSQTEAMQKLADAIERMTFAGGMMEGSYWKMFVKGIGQGIMSSKDFISIMFEIRRGLQQVFFEGVKLGRELIDIVPGLKDIGGGLKDLFNPTRITNLFKGFRVAIEKFFGKGDTDPEHPVKGSIPDLILNLKRSFATFFDASGPGAKKLLDGFKTFFRMMSSVAAQGIRVLAQSLADSAKTIVSVFRNGLATAGSAAGEGGSFLKEIMMPVLLALKDAWKILAPALLDLAKEIWSKFVGFLNRDDVKAKINAGLKPALMGLAGLLFGPAFGRAALASLTTTLLKIVVPGALGGMGKMLGLIASKASKAENAAKSVSGGAQNMQQVTAVTGEAGKAVEKGKGWGVKDATQLFLKLAAVAAGLSVGGVMMAGAIVLMKKILDAGGIKEVKDVEVPMLLIGEMALATIPMAAALRLMPKDLNPVQLALSGAVLVAAVGIVGLVGAGLSYVMKKAASPGELKAAGDMMLKMSLVFLAMVPLVLASAAIGALVMGPQGVFLGIAAAAGFAVLTAAVGGMAAVAMGVVKELNQIDIRPDFQMKIDAFLGIMKSIQTFADILTKLVGMMAPTFTELLSGKAQSFSQKVEAARGLINTMVGKKDPPSGIIGIVQTVLDSVQQLSINDDVAKKAEVFGTIMGAVTKAMELMRPPDAFFEAGSGFLSQMFSGGKSFDNLADTLTKHMNMMRENVSKLIFGDGPNGGLIQIIDSLKSIPFTDNEAKQAEVAGRLLSIISEAMKNIIPSGDTLKAFTTTVNTGLVNVGSFNLLGGKVDKLDTEAMGKTLTTIGDKMKDLLPALTTGVLGSVLEKTKDIKGDQLEALKVAADILKTAIDAARLISDNVKNGATATVNPSDLSNMTSTVMSGFGAVTELQDQLKGAKPSEMKVFGDNMTALASTIRGGEGGTGGVVGALMAVSEMVKQANALNDALGDGAVNKLDIKAKLEKVAQAVGLGGKASYTVNPSKAVQITLNVEVTMDVGEVEKVMILRKQSLIADRLDFATVRDPTGKLPAPLTSYTPSMPPAIPATAGGSR